MSAIRQEKRAISDARTFLTKLEIQFIQIVGDIANAGNFSINNKEIENAQNALSFQWKNYCRKNQISVACYEYFQIEANKIVEGYNNIKQKIEHESEVK